jgi:hypothetical protein
MNPGLDGQLLEERDLKLHIIMLVEISWSLFIWLIIRLFQLVFSAETVFFSHNKSANSVFQPAYQPNRTAPKFGFVFIESIKMARFFLKCQHHSLSIVPY